MLDACDSLPQRPRRIVVAGTSGSGKTTLAARLALLLGVAHQEIDGLYHGPGWTPREAFESDVRRFVAGPCWAIEWQYGAVRELLADRADLMVWLDLPHRVMLRQLIWRTARRSIGRRPLWNGNVEPPLWSILVDRDHVVRWAWRTRNKTALRVSRTVERRPGLPVVRLRSRADVERWLAGPLAAVIEDPSLPVGLSPGGGVGGGSAMKPLDHDGERWCRR